MKKIGIWPFGFYFLQFAGFATIGPFLVLYYQELGFSGTQLGLLTGIAPLVTFASSPAWTRIADRTGKHRLLMSIALLSGIGVLVAFPLSFSICVSPSHFDASQRVPRPNHTLRRQRHYVHARRAEAHVRTRTPWWNDRIRDGCICSRGTG